MNPIADEHVIDLLKPITIGRGDAAIEYATLTLREPTAGQLRKAMSEPDDIGVLMSLVQQTAAVPARVVEQLCQRDLAGCQLFFDQFSSATPMGSATSLLNASSPSDGLPAKSGDSLAQS
jgi:hypothetical protein